MAKAKMIKEVEVKFSPAFDKAINGVKTTKKATTKTAKVKTKTATAKTKPATKTRKAVAKPKAVKVAKPKTPRGYTITKVERELTLNGVKDTYELYELTGKGLAQPKYFVTEDYAKQYIERLKGDDLEVKALTGKTHGGMLGRGIMAETKDLVAAADLPELDTELPERCDKTSIEDIDA
jgi:hypothetical protein